MKSILKTAVVFLALSATCTAPAFAGDAESCKNVRFADVGWTDGQVTNGSVQIVLEALGYTTESKTVSLPVTFASLKNKDLDVFLDTWLPSMTGDIKPYLDDKSVEDIKVNLEGAGYGIVVPQYVADAGVKSLADLSANKDKFGGKIYGIEAGNDGNRIIQTLIDDPKSNLAGYELVESSEAGMLTEAEKAMKDNRWIVFLAWTPHPIMGAMTIHYLEGMGDSGFGPATVHTIVRASYTSECPNLGKLLSNVKFTLEMEGAMMEPVLKDNADPKETARAWLKAHPDAVKPWLDGVTTLDGGDAAVAVDAALKG